MMRTNIFKDKPKAALRVLCILSFAAVVAFGQQAVNMTAAPTSLIMPDGSTVPMWGYSCGAAVTGSTATCAMLNPTATGWSPVVITVPTGQDLQVNLTNSLTFTAGGGSNTVPTSLTIVGQLGGGLGASATSTPSPNHSGAQTNVTWPIAGVGGTPGTPPVQGNRVQSFSTEVVFGATTSLTWKAPRPGTYLMESGTHPSIQGPMGLYGIVVVTSVPAGATPGTAYPGVTYNAEVPLLFSEIDPVQNNAVNAAVGTVGFSETMVWSGQPSGCGNSASPTYHQCYPPAVNYSPLYYLINGAAFNKTVASASLFPVSPATGVTGNVLVRFVNAGLKMHVPSIVGAVTGTPATGGFGLIAEDGNPLPGVTRVQSEVFMAAGKTYDVMVNAPAAAGTAMPVYDRELSLSGNAIGRDAGMLAYIGINGAGLPTVGALSPAVARADSYSVVPGKTLTVSDPSKGLLANDTNVYGVQVSGTVPAGLALNADGTFSYTGAPTSFTYCGNGATSGAACATVTLGAATVESAGGITVNNDAYTSTMATYLAVKSPGVLLNDIDAAGYPLTVAAGSVVPGAGLTVTVDPSGAFIASVAGAGTYSFTYQAQNSQGTVSSTAATVNLTFPTPSGLTVKVLDGADKTTVISDYRWIIEEDRTFFIDPNCSTNPPPVGCIGHSGGIVPTFGTNFHTSFMPVVATGCTGQLSCEGGQTLLGAPAVCDGGNGVCRTTATQFTAVNPSQVQLDPTKRYYLSVLPGDAANPFIATNLSANCANGSATATNPGTCGHGMGGAPVPAACTPVAPATTCTGTFGSVTVLTQPSPYPPAKLSVFVFEDDFPLNGEQDGGGGIDVLSPNEPGLGGFNITIFDDAGGPGDPTGQVDYDMFNQPLTNSLAGTIDPSSGKDACPISTISTSVPGQAKSPLGITGTIVTCPKYESDGTTLSPLAGQTVVANMMPGRYGIVATPAADRIARGEEWLQTNTLDGQKAHDSFLRIGEPSFFQEFGPAGYHVTIGFANPKIINGRKAGVCNGTDPNITGTNCTNTVTGVVTTVRMSRTPDERLYSSGDNKSFAFTQCYASFGDPDGEDFAFAKCDADGRFTLSGLPDGSWRVTVFDQWNDMLVDGLSTPVLLGGGTTTDLKQLATNQWQANFNTRTFIDLNGDGVSQGNEPGLALVKTNVRFRDGSFSNRNNTDLNGYAAFNEEFPLFSWYVIETDVSRYKNTGTHVVYDAGGPADGTPCGGTFPPCSSTAVISKHLANTSEQVPLPAILRVPGAVYCDNADCNGFSIATGPIVGGSSGTGGSTARIDPPWVLTEGWQGFSGQNNFLEFGKKPYAAGENGGIRGHVIYSSTRPFDDPQFNTQNVWEPLVPGVTINLYQAGTAPDGSQSLTLVDTTKTSSFDDWAQGFRSDGIPNMNCPGQTTSDIFYFTLFNQPNYLDLYNSQHNGGTLHTLPNNSQFKCYDGMHNWNQLQPAPYDGMYQFPSVTGMNPTTGKPTGTNCTICGAGNPDVSDPYRSGAPMLPVGKYVVEVVVPEGYELVKEEDKNILIGDNFIAPVTVEFPNLGSAVYIIPDQAAVGSTYNANSTQNPTQSLGRIQSLTSHEGDTPTVDTFWPCAGQVRTVPDFISLFPNSHEVAPFAGATRPLCDRKLVTLSDQESEQAEFFVFTSTHAAAHFTGVITDDFTSEFDPFSPQFGEKFAPPYLPVSFKDWAGNEVSRVYADQWGAYNGLTYSTWEVNPPNPTGYSPTMMVTCMNDPGTGITPDPQFNPRYSQFCYEIPFMPAATQYMDTPVTPTSAFAGAGYNNPDCAYPDATPAVSTVNGDGVGPWVSASGKTLTITALGDQLVQNNAYSGPQQILPPYNQKTVKRHYGFGAAQGTVTIGGKTATVTPSGWSDTQITVTVPGGVPNCAIQQQAQYGGSTAQCGELVITAANGKQSIDAVTVTIGGKAPSYVTTTIQAAIDAAKPGDLIMVPAGVYKEMILMWKPVRLQGVGAGSSIINATPQPAGKMNDWRAKVTCLFGLGLNGSPTTWNSSCGAGWAAWTPTTLNPQIDRLPLEATVGWDATLNGNLAELLQEPTLMGALEGAAITVLSKGVDFPSNPFAADTFPTGTTLLTANTCRTSPTNATNPFPSSFWCNPSSIDGLGITNSSQGGGGINVHAWGHNLQIANNRIANNSGTLTGGISVGQGEHPGSYTQGGGTLNADPGSCLTTASPSALNAQLPYCFDMYVNIHNNAITSNTGTGDELFSATPAGAGGVSFCSGADYYKFNYNWLCGNLSTGDGGGMAQIGFAYSGDIEHNAVLFNQSTNPTISTNGGGILIMGAPDVDPTCGATTDQDCLTVVNGVVQPNPPSDGTGPGLVINANLIMGNAAESGSGGGLRFQSVNGTDVSTFPTAPSNWYSVTVTNNIIANNVAGWDGAGISLQDALEVNLVNNTIISNDTTASAGVLFNTLGAPLASASGPTCTANCGTVSLPQPAGLVAVQNSAGLQSVIGSTIVCPKGFTDPTVGTPVCTGKGSCTVNSPTYIGNANGSCKDISYPLIANDLFWQNRAFYIGVGALGTGTTNQQNVVSLYNAFTTTPAVSQPQAEAVTANGSGTIITGGTGACVPASYWDLGVRGDSGPSNHVAFNGRTSKLAPAYSVITDAADYATNSSGTALHNTGSNPTVVSQYCNGSRVPPELGSMGYNVPPGISDATVPNPIFNLTPAATIDEGNNWVNIAWGPLAEANPVNGAVLGNYGPAAKSPVINYISSTATTYAEAPSLDFFGNARKTNNAVDAGAVEYVGAATAIASVTGGPLAFGNQTTGSTSAAQTLTLHNTGGANLTGIAVVVTAPFSQSGGTCTATLAPAATCTIAVVFSPTATGAATGTATITANVAVTGSPVTLTGTGIASTSSASVSPSPLAFGTWATGTTSVVKTVTVTNTGTLALAGGTFTIAAPFSRVTTGTFPASAPNCGVALALGASCTFKVQFAPTTATASSGSLTVAYTGATVTPTPVVLTGTGVATRATVTIAPNPLTITLPSGAGNVTGIGVVTLTNSAAAGGSQVVVTNIAVAGGSFLTYFFNVGTVAGPDNCTGVALAPAASCTVTVRFTNVLAARGANRTGTITFTDGATGSPQSGSLVGVATP